MNISNISANSNTSNESYGPSVKAGNNNAALLLRQLGAIVRIEINNTLFSKRSLIAYILTLIPIILLLSLAFRNGDFTSTDFSIDKTRRIFGFIYSGFILGAVVFLGSAAIFTALFRGEILGCSMHYYLLSPVRRELIVLGKFLAGLLSAWALFGLTTLICYLLLYIPFGMTQLLSDMTASIAPTQMFTYLGITMLGCLGYGSLFMATGLIFRNPLFPVAIIAGWEFIHFVLPPALKFFSVIHYLKGLLPIPLNNSPLAIVVTPPSVLVSIISITVLALCSITITALYLKRLEIRYTES